jgi:HK97 family phage portal protein
MPKSLIGKVLNTAAGKAPIPFANRWNAQGGLLYGSGLQDRFTQLQAMGTQGTLYAVVQLLSTGSQALGDWGLYRKNQDGRVRYTTSDRGSDQREEVLQHLALKVWKQPNPFMTGAEFREIGWQFMELVGEWYWVMDRGPSGEGPPIEIWPVRPDRMEPVADKDKFLIGWVYTGPNGEAVPLAASEVIQLRYPCPTDIYRGMSAVQALLADIDTAKYSAEWSRNFFLNSATPGGIVQFAKRLSDEEFNEFTARWREQHQGVARGHRVGVLEQGAIWVPNTYTMKDMQFIELRGLSANNIREAYRIHPSMMGMVEDVNRANAETAEQVHIRWHEVPRLKRQRIALNEKFLPMYGETGKRVEFDYEDPSPASAEDANEELNAKSTAAQRLQAAGWDPTDILEVCGLPAMNWIGVQPIAVTGGTPAPRPSRPANEPRKSQYEGVEGNEDPENRLDLSAYGDVGRMVQEAFVEMFTKSNRNSNGHSRERV